MPRWLQSWWRQIYAPRRRPFRRLELEHLEERTLLSGGATLALAPPLPPFSAFQTAHVSGFLGATNEVDLYALPQLNAGDQVKVAITAQGEGSGLESALRIFDASGHQVAAATPDGGDPSLTFQAATGGAYFVGVSSAGNDTYSAILPGPSRLFGNTTGAYSLDVRLTPDAPLAADVTGGTFTLDPSSSLVAWSDPNNPVSISGSFTLQNRGGQDAAGFGVALVLSSNTVFDGSDPTVPLVSQFSTDPTTPLNGDSSSVPISFTAALPQGPPPGFPTSGPIYVGLVITPGPNDTDTFDKSGVHRGEDWQTLTILTPVPAGVTDLSQADPALNTQTGGTITAPGQTDTYTFTVTPSQGSGQLTAQVTGTGGALAPRLTLEGPIDGASGPAPTTVVPLGDGPGLDFSDSGEVPPDTQGAAGPSTFVESVNQTIALLTPSALATDSLSDFMSQGGLDPVDSSGTFADGPAVVYDDNVPGQRLTNGRYIIAALNVDESQSSPNFGGGVLDIAVSTSADPATLTAADWNFYQVTVTESDPVSAFFGGLPNFITATFTGNIGYDQDALIVTVNEGDPLGQLDPFGSESHTQVDAINIQDLVSGVPNDQLRFSQSDINDLNVRPATEHDAQPGDPEWLVSETGDGQHINVNEMTGVLSAAPTFTLTQLAVNPYIDTDLVPPLQPNGGQVTFDSDSEIQKAAEADGTLVAVQAVGLSVTQDAAQWYMIDVSSGTPVLEQQGHVSLGNNTYASFPAIDINPTGAVGMTFMDSGTGAGQFMSMYVTGRLPGDPAGQMANPTLVPSGTGQENYSESVRNTEGQLVDLNPTAGQISGINVDPTNGTFWAVNEFAGQQESVTENGLQVSANWGTAIANFGLASPPPGSGTSGSAPGGSFFIQSDDGTVAQSLLPGTYVLTVSAQSGAGSYGLVTEFAPGNPPLDPAPVGPHPSSVVVADFTGDGIPDIVTTTHDNTVSVLLGNGDGSFGPAKPFFAGGNPDGIAVADLTGDGKEDIIVADGSLYDPFTGTTGGGVTVLLGDGDGNFQAAAPVFLPYSALAVAVADVNGDGIPDLVVTEGGHFDSSGTYIPGDTVAVLPGIGDGTFGAPQNFTVGGSEPSSVAVADLNGDGMPDIITANLASDTVSVLTNTTATPGAVTFAKQELYSVGSEPGTVAVADVNGDGRPDILVANDQGNNAQDQGLSVLLNTTAPGASLPSFGKANDFGTGFVPFSMAVGYLNGDDNPDVVVANFGEHTVSVLLGNGDGTFSSPQSFATGFYPVAVAVADLNGDGHPDIVVANPGSGSLYPGYSVRVLLGNGDGTFQAPPSIAAGAGPVAAVMADLTGNGKQDAVVVDQQDNTVRVLLGNGDGSFQAGQIISTGDVPDAVAVSDLNGDGKPDLVVANQGDGTVSVLLGNGDGTFQDSLDYLNTHTFKVGFDLSVAIADINGDGIPDIVVTSENAYDPGTHKYVGPGVSVLLGNGDGTFQTEQTFAVPLGAGGALPTGQGLAVADLNGDGKPDLVVVNEYKTVSVLLNETQKGATTVRFGAPQAVFAGYYPTSVVVADINGDGKPVQQALVVGHYIFPASRGGLFQTNNPTYPTNTVTVLLNGTPTDSGTVKFSAKKLSAGTDPSTVAVADLTGDGDPDIIAANFRSDAVSVLQGDGTGTFASAETIDDAGFTPTAVLAADVNGDGNQDIVVANEFGGSLTVFLSDGQLTGQGDTDFAPASPERQDGTNNTPFFADLTAAVDVNDKQILDSVVLDDAGNILFRQGEAGSDNLFAAPVILNPGNPARDIAIVQTADGFAVAAADADPDLFLSARSGQTEYTVSLYTVGPDGTPQAPTLAFSTTLLPTRIAAGDLTNGEPNGLSEIVVADGLDNAIQVAFPEGGPNTSNTLSNQPGPRSFAYTQGTGSFVVTATLPTDGAPSAIALVHDAQTPGLLDIAVTNLASGDITLYLNDPSSGEDRQPAFSAANRLQFRTGTSPYQSDATGVVSSFEQPVSLAAGNFLGNGRDDLVVVNRGTHSFSVLTNDGDGGYLDPQPDLTFSTSGFVSEIDNQPAKTPGFQVNNEPGPVVAGYFNGPDQPEDLAILMENSSPASSGQANSNQDTSGQDNSDQDNSSQVWIYTGDGRGHFTFTGDALDVGQSATGLTVVPGSEPGTFDLLVGNSFGDILRLIGNGQGGFTPEVLNGTRVPLDVEQIGGHVQALVANQALNQVLVATRTDNGQFSETVVFNLPANVPFNPGDAHWFSTSGTPTPDNTDAVVVASGSNQVFVYHFDPGTQQLDPTPLPFSVGTDPTSVTVADLGTGAPSLIVTNAGSNDVSIIFGSVNSAGQWVGTEGPRLNSGGKGPVATQLVLDSSGVIKDLAVFNSDGTVSLLPSRGDGFFDDRAASVQSITVPGGLTTVTFPPGSNSGFGITGEGSVVSLDLNNTLSSSLALSAADDGAVNALEDLADGEVIAAFSNGTVADLVANSADELSVAGIFAPLTEGLTDPSALQFFNNDVLATQAGSDQLFVFALESTSPVTTVTAADNLSLVVTILFNGETTNTNTATGADNGASFALTAEGIGSFLASLNLSQLVGGPEGDLASNQSTGTGNPIDAGIDLDGKLRGIDLYPNGDTDPDRTVISRRESAPVPVENRPAPRDTILADVLNAWESLPAVMAPNAVTVPELTVTNRQPVESGGSQSDVIVETDSTASDTDATPPQAPIMPAESADGNDAAMPAVIPDAGMALDRTILASLAVGGWVHQIPTGERTADTRRTSPGRSRTRLSTLGP